MSTPVLDVRSPEGLREGIARAGEVLRAGGLVAFPTETVYGLGANALKATAVRRIFRAKGRPPTNPVIVHVAEVGAARDLAAGWPEAADRLAERFWPGPLTLVVPRRPHVPDNVTAGGPTVAIRVPAHPVALALLRECGLPVAAPSANRSNRLSPTLAEHVRSDLDGRIDLILDGGPTPGGIESTVVDVTCSPPRLLRPGLIAIAELEGLLGEVAVGSAQPGAALPSPGMLTRHYSPYTPLELTHDAEGRARELAAKGQRVAIVSHLLDGAGVARMPAEPAEYARALYATLREVDLRGLDRILLTPPPDGEEWRAIHDRLRRAAT
jgi:L-threonylcarbamoyladenylate synthase